MLLSVEIRCPECDSPSVIRHGRTPQTTQRFRCRRCARTFINPADQRGYSQAFKEQVLAAYQERASMRGISRVFKYGGPDCQDTFGPRVKEYSPCS